MYACTWKYKYTAVCICIVYVYCMHTRTAGPAIELHEHDSILILATEGVRTSGFLRCNTLGQDLQIMMAPTSETAPIKS